MKGFKVFDTKKKEFVEDSEYSKFFLSRSGCLLWYDGYDIFNAKPNFIPIYSTGLKDKNGKEYEDGSIFNVDGILYLVFKDPNNAAFMLKPYAINRDYGVVGMSNFNLRLYEIIGSKYTNPELLEE